MISIINYGLGNIKSISGALERIGVSFRVTSDPGQIQNSSGLILPGVGAFPDAMARLADLNLIEALHESVLKDQLPVLGICLGFQIMTTVGHEFTETQGLGWIPGRVIALKPSDPQFRVPHVGWNDSIPTQSNAPLLSGIPGDALFYFTHSFHMVCDDPNDVIARSDHGQSITAAVTRNNIYGTQFHPEKSQLRGLELLRNFATKLVKSC